MKADIFFDQLTQESAHLIMSVPILHQFDRLNLTQLKLFAKEYHVFIDYFPQYLGALIHKSPNETIRLAILDNLVEESGGMEQVEHLDGSKTHPEIYRRFAYKLGVTKQELFSGNQRPYSNKMLNDLKELSTHADFFTALGGITPGIENVFHQWIGLVYQGLRKHDFLNEEDLYFFSSHAIMDIEHGEKFKQCLLPFLDVPKRREQLSIGATRMEEILKDFFTGLADDFA